MTRYARRDFLKAAAALAAGLKLGGELRSALADGLEQLAARQCPLVWLQAQSCSGCSVSFLNAESPGVAEVLTEVVSLVFHSTVSAAQGDVACGILDRMAQENDFLLVLEGAIPVGMPEACVIGGKPIVELLPPLLRRAKAIVAAGTCAAFGGIPAAEGNPTQAVGMRQFMEGRGIPWQGRLINCPGCPTHPMSIVATLAYLLARGYPPVVEERLTPRMFYANSVHDECPRFHYWEKRVFAEKFGDEGCLFNLGCLGPLSHTNCPRRQWNGGVNWCIRAGAPCTACTSEEFAQRRDFAFYRKGERYHLVNYREAERRGPAS